MFCGIVMIIYFLACISRMVKTIYIHVDDKEFADLEKAKNKYGFTWLQLLRTCKK